MLRFAVAVTGRASTMGDDIEACPLRLGKSSAFHPEFLGLSPVASCARIEAARARA